MNLKGKFLTNSFLLLLSTVVVKVISAIYKIPLTSYIGAVGRGYYAYAYNLCMPIHALTMGTFPIALSKLVSMYNAKKDTKMVYALKSASLKLFSLVGFICMLIIVVVSKFYCNFIAESPKSIYTVLVIAPSVLFSCMAASYRGFFEGNLNMVPTAISQTLETVVKMIFGLAFAKLSMAMLFKEFLQYNTVLGTVVNDENAAFSIIYPVTSACSMFGVTFGTFVSFCFVYVYGQINCKKELQIGNTNIAKKELLEFSYPIIASTAIQSIFQFLENASIQLAINKLPIIAIKNMYCKSISISNVLDKDLSTYVYGIFSTALDFKNIVPGITMALGVCAVPAISQQYEKSKNNTVPLVNAIIKYTVALSLYGGVILACCSNEILGFFYQKSSPDIVVAANELVKYFGFSVVFYSTAGISVYILQALGIPKKAIPAYIISGIVRILLNNILIKNENLILFGPVISGAVGYLIMTLINFVFVVKYSGIKIEILKNFVLPVLVFLCTFVACEYIKKLFCIETKIIENLIIKSLFLTIFYLSMCFLCGLLKFGNLFCYFKQKKVCLKA